MIVRVVIPLAAFLLGVCSQFTPPSWGHLTPSPYIKKANGTKNSITIPYDLTEAYKNLGLPPDYRVVYNYSFEYPNNPFLPPSTGYTYIYGSKGSTYEWWRPPRTEDGRPIPAAGDDGSKQQQRPQAWWNILSSPPSDDRPWIPIGKDQEPQPRPANPHIVNTAPFFGASPMIYILANKDASSDHVPVSNRGYYRCFEPEGCGIYRSVDGPVENKERDFPPGLFAAANRDDDSGFAYYRRFAADKDEDGFARFAGLPTASRFAADNIDPHPLVHNRADLLWTRR